MGHIVQTKAPFRPAADLRTTLAMTVRPCMSIPGAPPRITSMRRTEETGIRLRISSRESFFDTGGSPSMSTFPPEPESPRTAAPLSKAKPGSLWTISRAVEGPTSAKKDGG